MRTVQDCQGKVDSYMSKYRKPTPYRCVNENSNFVFKHIIHSGVCAEAHKKAYKKQRGRNCSAQQGYSADRNYFKPSEVKRRVPTNQLADFFLTLTGFTHQLSMTFFCGYSHEG